MKKLILSISLLLLVTLFMFRSKAFTLLHPMRSNELTYAITDESGAPTFNIEESDSLLSLTHMEQLVGTLVKYGATGRYEPFLAQSWTVSADRLKWSFTLRNDIQFEDGLPITAHTYVTSLKKALKLYSRRSTVPVFELLANWNDFISGTSDLTGLTAKGDLFVEFSFSEAPEGFLEYLSMPYYGALHPSDISESGWKDASSIISSGPYQVHSNDPGRTLVLTKQPHYFSHHRNSPAKVTIKYLPFETAKSLPQEHLIIYKKLNGSERIPDGFKTVLGTPNILTAIELDPESRFFHASKQRLDFRDTLGQQLASTVFPLQSARLASSFYPGSNLIRLSAAGERTLETTIQVPNTKLKVLLSASLPPVERAYVEALLNSTMHKLNVAADVVTEDRSRSDWLNHYYHSSGFDIRVKRVDIGGSFETWVVRMMFCSKLGVSFPDPTGQICTLTATSNQELQPDFTKQAIAFEEYVHRDAAVIPIYHSGLAWLFGKGIDLEAVSPTMSVPRFDLIPLQ